MRRYTPCRALQHIAIVRFAVQQPFFLSPDFSWRGGRGSRSTIPASGLMRGGGGICHREFEKKGVSYIAIGNPGTTTVAALLWTPPPAVLSQWPVNGTAIDRACVRVPHGNYGGAMAPMRPCGDVGRGSWDHGYSSVPGNVNKHEGAVLAESPRTYRV